MNIYINKTLVKDVAYFTYNGCELSFHLENDHTYNPFEFLKLMETIFDNHSRFHFKGWIDTDVIECPEKCYEQTDHHISQYHTEGFGVLRNPCIKVVEYIN